MFVASSDKGKLLDHDRISEDKALELMVDYLGVDLEAFMREFEKTIGIYSRFEFLKKVYTDDLFIVG